MTGRTAVATNPMIAEGLRLPIAIKAHDPRRGRFRRP